MNDKLKKWNYQIHLDCQNEWWRYFGEYQQVVELVIKKAKESEVTVVARPLLFLMRHTLELGYKGNIVELEKVSGLESKLEFSGKKAHSLERLHKEFERHFKKATKLYTIESEVVSQFDSLNSTLKKLKDIFHQLDAGSYAFRYPFQGDGRTPTFQKEDVLKIEGVIELYNTAITVLKYTTDVVAECLPPTSKN